MKNINSLFLIIAGFSLGINACNPCLVEFGGFCMFIRVSSFCVKYGNIHIKLYIEGANWPQFIHGLMK